MIIKKIEINNLFKYNSCHEINLARPQKGRNVNIIVANNGSGKTSLYYAINLLFKGVMFDHKDENFFRKLMRSDGRIKDRDVFLGAGDVEGIINKEARSEGNENDAYIMLELEDTKHGMKNIVLKRSFSILKKGGPVSYFKSYAFSERLEVIRDGKTYTDKVSSIKDEELGGASEELSRIVNPRLVDFFFFDGEEIRSIARNLKGSLGEKIKELLNITALENLNKYIENTKKNFKNTKEEYEDKRGEYANAKRVRDNYKSERETASREYQRLKEDLDGLKEEKVNLEKKIAGSQTEQNKEHEKNKEAAIFATSNYAARRSDFNKNDLKYLLHAANLSMLKDAYSLVKKSAIPEEESKSLKKLMPKLRENLEALLVHNGQGDTVKSIGSLMNEAIEMTIKELQRGADDIIGVEAEYLRAIIDNELVTSVQNKIYELGGLYEKRVNADKRIKDVIADNKEVDEETDKKKSNIKLINSRITDITAKMQNIKREIERLDEYLNKQNRKVDEIDNELKDMYSPDEQTKVANDLSKIVKKYTTARMNECKKDLKSYIEKCLSLFYPDKEITVEIDSDFKISIYGDGEQIKSASAGQEQFIATSIIYALFEVAILDFPIIIDTPLGRIDTPSSKIFYDRVYPEINEQVILLVTTSELGTNAVRKIAEPHLADLHIMHKNGVSSTSSDISQRKKIELLNTSDIYEIDEI